MTKEMIAKKYFCEGCNCCQAVVAAFREEIGMDFDTLMRLSSSFGAGMGGLGEVCGAVSGMFLVLGAKFGYDPSSPSSDKPLHYARIRAAAERFVENHASIICRELKTGDRDRAYCADLVECAAAITASFLENQSE